VLAITFDQVDFVEGTVHIDRRVNYVKGGGLQFGPVKSTSTERTIQLPTFALDILKRRHALGYSTAFTGARGGLLSQNNIRRTLREVTVDTEFEKWLTPHSGRKTVATVVNDELGSAVAGKVLGHDGDRLIVTTYGERKTMAPSVTHITDRFAWKRPTGD
jgi:integrase